MVEQSKMTINLLNFLELMNAMIVTVIVTFIILFFIFNGQLAATGFFIVSLVGSYVALYLINKYFGASFEKTLEKVKINGVTINSDGSFRNAKCGMFDNIVLNPFPIVNSLPDMSLGIMGFIWSYINTPNLINNQGKLTEMFSSEILGVITIMTILVIFAASGKVFNKCVSIKNAIISILLGISLGITSVLLITMGDNDEYLFNAYSSRKAICGRTNKKFRCKKVPKE